MLLIPIWFCLTNETREALRRYQWERHRRSLIIPLWPRFIEVETLEEIAELMPRQVGVMEKKPK